MKDWDNGIDFEGAFVTTNMCKLESNKDGGPL